MFASDARTVAAHQAAVGAKADAADAFVALDDTQKRANMLVTAFARLDEGSESSRLRKHLAALNRIADAASQSWIDTLDTSTTVLEAPRTDLRSLRSTESAFQAAKRDLDEARKQFENFESVNRDIESRVQDAWAQVSRHVAAAQQELAHACLVVAEVRSTGIRSAALEAKLTMAERITSAAAEQAPAAGFAATLRSSAAAVAAARDVTAMAINLRNLAPETARRLTSTRTRLDGIEVRLRQVDPTLSSLRRRFSLACSSDLDAVPADAQQSVTQARDLLTSATIHARADSWEEAAGDLERCQRSLSAAEGGVNAVVQRLRDLEAVAADPSRERASTQFVVHDAQTLVVSLGAKAPTNEIRVLDSLVRRLEEAGVKLETAHPDYWSYLVELRAVRDLANAVVRRVRAAVAVT